MHGKITKCAFYTITIPFSDWCILRGLKENYVPRVVEVKRRFIIASGAGE